MHVKIMCCQNKNRLCREMRRKGLVGRESWERGPASKRWTRKVTLQASSAGVLNFVLQAVTASSNLPVAQYQEQTEHLHSAVLEE